MESLLAVGVTNALMAGALALAAFGVKRARGRPALVHCLWLLALLKLLMPPVVTLPMAWLARPSHSMPAGDLAHMALGTADDAGWVAESDEWAAHEAIAHTRKAASGSSVSERKSTPVTAEPALALTTTGASEFHSASSGTGPLPASVPDASAERSELLPEQGPAPNQGARRSNPATTSRSQSPLPQPSPTRGEGVIGEQALSAGRPTENPGHLPEERDAGLIPDSRLGAGLPSVAAVLEASRRATAAFAGETWGLVAGWCWLTGSAICFALAAIRVGRFQRLLRHARPAPAELAAEARRLAERLGLHRCPEVLLVPGHVGPLLWAVGGRPRLVLPAELLERLDAEQQATMLAHELAHLRRRDHWARLIELAATGLYWWHPVVWWARRELREAEEQCCDAWVVWALPAAARAYARTLVETVSFLSQSRPAWPAMASGLGQVCLLRRRLTMIMHGKTPNRLSLAGRVCVLALGALLLPLVPSWAQTKAPLSPEQAREKLEGIKQQIDDLQAAGRGEEAEKLAQDAQALKASLQENEAALAKELGAKKDEVAKKRAELAAKKDAFAKRMADLKKLRAAKAKADYDAAAKALEEYEPGTASRQEKTYLADLTVAQENLKRAEENAKHTEELYRRGFANKSELEAAQFALTNTRLNLDKAQTALNTFLNVTRPKVLAQLQLAQLRGDLESKRSEAKPEPRPEPRGVRETLNQMRREIRELRQEGEVEEAEELEQAVRELRAKLDKARKAPKAKKAPKAPAVKKPAKRGPVETDVEVEIEQAVREAQEAAQEAAREAQEAAREAQQEAEEAVREARAEAEEAAREAQAEVDEAMREAPAEVREALRGVDVAKIVEKALKDVNVSEIVKQALEGVNVPQIVEEAVRHAKETKRVAQRAVREAEEEEKAKIADGGRKGGEDRLRALEEKLNLLLERVEKLNQEVQELKGKAGGSATTDQGSAATARTSGVPIN